MRFVAATAVSLLCLASAPRPAAAASPAPPMTADQLVAKNLEARGGAAKLAALRSMRLTGKLVLGAGDRQIQAAWAQIQKRPGMIRTETTLQGLTQVETYDGKDAWTLDPFEGRRDAQRDSADDARICARDADIEGPLVTFS